MVTHGKFLTSVVEIAKINSSMRLPTVAPEWNLSFLAISNAYKEFDDMAGNDFTKAQ